MMKSIGILMLGLLMMMGMADGQTAYIANQIDNSLSVVNVATNMVVSTIPGFHTPYGVFVSPDGTKVYVTNLVDSTVSVINTITNSISATIIIPNPQGICVSTDGSKVYVAGSEGVYVINSTTNIVNEIIPINSPSCIAVNPDGNNFYVGGEGMFGTTVWVINTITNIITDSIIIGSSVSPVSICVSPNGRKVLCKKTIQVLHYIQN